MLDVVWILGAVVYTLLLEGGKFYICYTTQRGYPWSTQAHFKSERSAWNRLHKPLKALTNMPGAKKLKWKETLGTTKLHGWQSVRDAAWTACKLRLPPVAVRDLAPSVCLQSACLRNSLAQPILKTFKRNSTAASLNLHPSRPLASPQNPVFCPNCGAHG